MIDTTNTDRQPRRILLECTDTYFSDWNTGIQRVCRNVASESRRIGREYSIPCQPIIRIGNRYLALPWKPHITRAKSRLPQLWNAIWPSRQWWDQRATTRFIRWLGVRIRKALYPRSLVRKVHYLWWSLQGETIEPGPSDVLVLLDAWWNRDVWPLVAEARSHGARVGVVMYDLLPVTHPQFFKSNVKEPYRRSLAMALENGDFFVAISRSVRDVLRAYAKQEVASREWPDEAFAFFRLGSTLDMAKRKGAVRDSVRRAFEPAGVNAPYLTVGTIEPRKNHATLFDAFELIWQQHPDAKLCIVGRIGWLCNELVKKIWRHERFGRTLFMFNDLSDTELAYCYRHAKAFIFPSHAEGFGLPLVEALQYQLQVMASDIPIHREVGQDFCAYFDPNSAASLARLVTQLEATGLFPPVRTPDQFALPDWTESTREFISKCLEACRHLPVPAKTVRRAA